MLAMTFLLFACASLADNKDKDDDRDKDDNIKLSVKVSKDTAENAEIVIVLGKGGKLDFYGVQNKELRKYHVGEERPINIEKILPKEKIKTLDQLMIFSGSPSCISRDGWVYCP